MNFTFDKQYDYSPYVFSFSKHKDELSQWRADGSGEVCIEFDAQALSRLTRANLLKVRYLRPDDVDNELQNAMENYIDGKLCLLRAHGRLDGETVMEGARDLRRYIQSTLAPIGIKHAGFEAEGEYRLTRDFRTDLPPDGVKMFFDDGRYPKPHAEISFLSGAYSENPSLFFVSEVVKGILFGPGSDADLATSLIAVVNQTLRTNYAPQFSTIPYRT